MNFNFSALLLLIFRALSTSCLFFIPFLLDSPQMSSKRVKPGVSLWLSRLIHGERAAPGSPGARARGIHGAS